MQAMLWLLSAGVWGGQQEVAGHNNTPAAVENAIFLALIVSMV